MSLEPPPRVEFTVTFEPDTKGEAELDDTLVNAELITDKFIGDSRIVGFVDCVEYGSVQNKPGVLVILTFNYHPVKTFFRDGAIRITLSGAPTTSIRSLSPNCSIREVTAGTETTTSVSAGLRLGVANYVEGNLGCTKERQYKSIHYVHFHGSGERTKQALWTLEEKNAESGNRIGLPSPFSVAMVVQADGMLELRVDIRGTVGWYERTKDAIRKIRSRRDQSTTISLDGMTRIGERPPSFVVAEDLFKSNPAT